MANAILGTRNLLDKNEYYPVVLSQGSYNSLLPRSNLKDPLMVNSARTSNVTLAATKFEVGYTVPRSIKISSIPRASFSRNAKVRIRYSVVPKWLPVETNGTAILGASSISFQAGSVAANITTGDVFRIAGDTTDYTAGTTAAIAANGTATISISPVLAVATTDALAITCYSGDYTVTTRDTGWVAVWKVIYPFGTLPYGHPSAYDGKADAEEVARISPAMPFIDVVPAATEILAQFQLVEIDDTSNAAGFVDLERYYCAGGWQPSINIAYGVGIGRNVNTQVDATIGGARFYNVRASERAVGFSADNIPFDEAMVYVNQFHDEVGIHNQVMFVLDPADETNLHRTAFLCTLEKLDRYTLPYYQRINSPFNVLEVIE